MSRICRIPLQETGAFNLFAWQAVWAVGSVARRQIGTGDGAVPKVPAGLRPTAGAACLFFIGIRYGWLGPHLTQSGARPATGQVADRSDARASISLLSRSLFTGCENICCAWWRLSRFSLSARLRCGFSALTSFSSLSASRCSMAMSTPTVSTSCTVSPAIALLAVTFTALILVARDEVRKKRAERKHLERARDPASFSQAWSRSASEVPVSADNLPHTPVLLVPLENEHGIAPAVDRANIVQ